MTTRLSIALAWARQARYGRSMSSAPDDELRDEILRAFKELRPQMIPNARKDADLDPTSIIGDFGDAELEQFLNAWESMFTEALEGTGRQTRDFILDTALPPVVESGPGALAMIRSQVVSAVMLAHRLLPLVKPERRDDAARWLAAYHSGYTYEVAGRALAIEGGKGS